jgi:hypothetical protein
MMLIDSFNQKRRSLCVVCFSSCASCCAPLLRLPCPPVVREDAAARRPPFSQLPAARSLPRESSSAIVCGTGLDRSPAARRSRRCSIWELNHVCDEQGKETFRQVILWRMRTYEGTTDYFVVAWKMAEHCRQPEHINGRWIGVFAGERVEAELVIETWGSVDWEVEDRKRMPTRMRR